MKGELVKLFLLLCVFVVGGCSSAERDPEDVTPGDVSEIRVGLEDRLLAEHVEANGWGIVSRDDGGNAENRGEALLWWGVAQYVLPTEKAKQLWPGLLRLLEQTNGGLWRDEPLGEYEDGRGVTWDGAVGFYLGVAAAIVLHGGADTWRPVFARHLAYVESHGGELLEGTGALVAPGFDFVPDLLAHRLGLRGAPADEALSAMEVAMPSFISTVLARRNVCYPMNLSFLSVLTARILGVELHQAGRDALCLVTAGGDVPTLDNYCGRKHILEHLRDFKLNEWEFRHQRCGGLEQPDGGGLETPALDALLDIKLGYGG